MRYFHYRNIHFWNTYKTFARDWNFSCWFSKQNRWNIWLIKWWKRDRTLYTYRYVYVYASARACVCVCIYVCVSLRRSYFVLDNSTNMYLSVVDTIVDQSSHLAIHDGETSRRRWFLLLPTSRKRKFNSVILFVTPRGICELWNESEHMTSFHLQDVSQLKVSGYPNWRNDTTRYIL